MAGKLGRKDALYDARRTATLTLAAPVGTAAGGGDADTIDGFHAAASPTVGFLLALDASAQFPDSTIPAGIARDSEVTADIATHAALTDVHHVAFVGLEDNAGAVIPLAADDRIQITDDGVINANAEGNTLALSIAQGQIDHGSIGGLGGDDHSQYVHISSARTITAQHSFSPASALPPFTLGANAQGQLVTGLRADQLNKSVSAGNGLTGGGTLTADRTFHVGAGNGIVVAADSVAVDLVSAWSGLEFSGGDLRIDLDAGYTWTGTHLHTGASEVQFRSSAEKIYSTGVGYLDLRAGSVINLYAPTLVILNAGSGIIKAYSDLEFQSSLSIRTWLAGQSLTIEPKGDLHIEPGGDLHIDPGGQQIIFDNWDSGDSIDSSDYVSQTTGWSISYGSSGGHADFRSIYADELHVQAFIADIYEAHVGAIIVTKSRARLSRDFTIPANTNTGTLYLEDLEGWEDAQLFSINDVVRLRFIDTSGGGLIVTDVWGTVTNYTNLTGGEQSYTFTTSDDGEVSGSQIFTGAIALDYGQTGSGSRGTWEATVLDAAGAPYSQVATWETNPWTAGNWTARVRLGNLDGISGIGLEHGLWAGQNTTDTFLLLSDSSFEVHGLDVKLYDGASNTVRLDPATPSFAMGATLPAGFATGEGIWMGKDTTYKFRVGDPAGERVQWDPANGLYIYDGDNQAAFYAKPDGSVWMSQLAISAQAGDFLFSQADGLLLLGPGCEITPTSWTSLRGQAATISGAFHQEAGAWPGTRGLVVEGGTTNLVPNPSFETNLTGWANFYSPTRTRVSGGVFGDYCQQVACDSQYDGAWYSPAFNAAASTTYTYTVYLRLESGTLSDLRMRMYRQDNTILATSSALTLTSAWQRFELEFTTDAGTTGVRPLVFNSAVDTGTFQMDGAQVELKDYMTSYCDGSLGTGYSWNGTAHASSSMRTATVIDLASHGDLISSNNTLSFRVVVQVLHDYDDSDTPMYWNVYAAKNIAGTDQIVLFYDRASSRWYVRVTTGGVNENITNGTTSFSAGDWIDLIVTLDFTSNMMYLYENGVQIGSQALTLATPSLTIWKLGTDAAGAAPLKGEIVEYAVFNSILTAEEVAAIYALGKPLVDTGAMKKPGIYLLDGQFTLASATANEHVQLEAVGIGIYDGTGPTGVGRLLGGFVNATDKKLDITSDDLGWFGYDSSDVLQVAWYGSGSDAGKIVAGAGDVTIDSDGVSIEEAAGGAWVNRNAYKIINTSGAIIGGMWGFDNVTNNQIVLEARERSGLNSTVMIKAICPSSDSAYVHLEAKDSTGGGVSVQLRSSGHTRISDDVRIEDGLCVGSFSYDPEAKVLQMANRTSDPSTPVGGAIFYSYTGEMYVMDVSGNKTQLSPHYFDLIPSGPSELMAWSFYSERHGRRINVDMLRVIRLVEEMSDEQLVYIQ